MPGNLVSVTVVEGAAIRQPCRRGKRNTRLYLPDQLRLRAYQIGESLLLPRRPLRCFERRIEATIFAVAHGVNAIVAGGAVGRVITGGMVEDVTILQIYSVQFEFAQKT